MFRRGSILSLAHLSLVGRDLLEWEFEDCFLVSEYSSRYGWKTYPFHGRMS
jgi:hypothetical protein